MNRTTPGDPNGRYLKLEQYAFTHNIGRATARKIGERAGALCRIGRLVLIDASVADAFLDAECREARK